MKYKQIMLASVTIAEARNREMLLSLGGLFDQQKGLALLNTAPKPERGKTVFLIAGLPETIFAATLEFAITAATFIESFDENRHIGPVDTITFYPIENITLSDTVTYAKKLSRELYARLKTPLFYHKYKSYPLYREYSDFLRERGKNGLTEKIAEGLVKPTLGSTAETPPLGYTLITARIFPVRFNINISTFDADIAYRIAQRFDYASHAKFWSAGRNVSGRDGQVFTIPSKLSGIRALHVSNEYLKFQQLSFLVFEPETTPLYCIYEVCRCEAEDFGVEILGSEIHGFISARNLSSSFAFYCNAEADEEKQRAQLIDRLQLQSMHKFEPEYKIIEQILAYRY
jgi:glutamate formiminotransferase